MKKLEELVISPAPWKVCDSGKNNGCIVDAEGAVCASGAATGCPPANAILIAAAPKMYAKAWELLSAFDERAMTPGHVEALRAALAEASGESEVK